MEALKQQTTPRVLNVASQSASNLDKVNNPKLRKLAKSIQNGQTEVPSAGHLNYFRSNA